MDWLLFIVIGCVAGFLAGKIMRGGGFGLVMNLILGVIGGFVGGWLLKLIGVSWGGIVGSLCTSVIGAVVVLFVASLFKK